MKRPEGDTILADCCKDDTGKDYDTGNPYRQAVARMTRLRDGGHR